MSKSAPKAVREQSAPKQLRATKVSLGIFSFHPFADAICHAIIYIVLFSIHISLIKLTYVISMLLY